MTAISIQPMLETHWSQVAKIYADGMATGYATFETKVPEYRDWDAAHLNKCRLVALKNNKVVGWAALSPVSGRCVYGGVAEVSVYVALNNRGHGIGVLLMQHLIDQSEAQGYWTLQSGIFPENKGSIRLHEKMGFRYLGTRERIGKLHGVWKDNVLYERRSTVVGV